MRTQAEKQLNRVREGWSMCQRSLARIEELEALATKITPVLTGMPHGGNSKPDDKWAMLISCKQACEEQVQQYLKDCAELEQELKCIKNPRIRAAMQCRYIDCLTVEKIAELMNSDMRTIYRYLSIGRTIYADNFKAA